MEDDRIISLFEDTKNRVRSMALVHEELYQSKDFARIDFSDYIQNLSNTLYRAYSTDSKKFKLDLKITRIYLGIDQAIPCGLIINELISNALKHAFIPPWEGKGKIKVILKETDKHEIELIVNDNGNGLPKEFNFSKTESLGLQLVRILAEDQLRGKVKLDRKEGTKFSIKFKKF